jgi:ABC-type oligopeptide transport system ATPase subunit
VQNILKNLSKLGKLKYIVISHKFPKRQKISEGEIFILFVGIIVLPEVTKIIAEEEKTYGNEINYTAMTEEEFNFRKKNNDPFIWSFLRLPKILIVGDEDELVKS